MANLGAQERPLYTTLQRYGSHLASGGPTALVVAEDPPMSDPEEPPSTKGPGCRAPPTREFPQNEIEDSEVLLPERDARSSPCVDEVAMPARPGMVASKVTDKRVRV